MMQKKIKKLVNLLLSLIWHPFITIRSIKEKVGYELSLKEIPKRQLSALKALKNKRPLRCVFFVVYYQTWKYDRVYRIMENMSEFDPIILICPIVNFGKENMIKHIDEAYNYFKTNSYNVIRSYDDARNQYVDVRKELSPDIIFYTNPYYGLIDERYYINNYLDLLTVYVPYAFNNNVDLNFCHNLPLHNLLWRYYAESEEHKSYSMMASKCRGRNVVVTGYPGIENLIDKTINTTGKDWKINNPGLKRIIWAPHHTITNKGSVVYSCFLMYSHFMLEMAEKYKDQVQFVFKPHPILKSKLDLLWGKDKADDYYNQWRNKANCSINDGIYTDLFLTSDAMIHDSGSFLIEYLYVNKPVMRTLNDIPLKKLYNPFALKCLENYYMAYTENDIEKFILDIIHDVDPLKEKRTKFVKEVLMPEGSPSQNIIDDILDSIDNQILYRK